MSREKIQAEFDKKGYTSVAFINKAQFIRVLNQLMKNGQQFHDEVAEELWSQAAGERSQKEVKVSDVCSTIVDAQNILWTRIQQLTEQIQTINSQKRRLNASTSKEAPKKIEQMQKQLNTLYEFKQSLEEDFYLVTQPFNIQTRRPTAVQKTEDPSASAKQSPELTLIFYIILAYGFLEIIMIYGKPDFLNLIVLTCLLSLYLMNFFDKVYIRLNLALLAISIVLDLIWLILYASHKWNPAAVSNQSIYKISYARYIVFFTAALMPLKGLLIFFLSKYRNATGEQSYVVSLGIIKLMLSNNKKNPISKELANTAIMKILAQ